MSLSSFPAMSDLGGGEAGPGPGSAASEIRQHQARKSGAKQKQAELAHLHQDIIEYDPFRTYKVFFSGALSGAISRTATAPFDRLKMLLQTHDGKKGLTLRQGWQHMVAEGSFKSFFKGNGANVVKIAPETALKLTLNDSIRSLVAADPDRVKVRERMASGGIAGAIAQGLLYPLDTIRTRLAVSPPNTYAGILHAAYRIRRDEGLAAFYRGLTPSMIGILPFAGVDIALFEVFKEIMYEKYDGRPPHMGIVVAGMMSSSIAQVVSYPLALVRTRLQAQTVCRPRAHAAPAALHKRGHNHSHGPLSHAHSHPHTHHVPAPHGHALPTPHHTAPPEPASSASHAQHTQQPKYRGMVDVFRKTIEYEGVRGLYKGLLPNLLKMAPAAGIGWYIFEETKFALGVDPRS